MTAWCARRGVPLHASGFTPGHAQAGLARDAAYLLRPDDYVALAERDASPAALDRYLAERGITLG